MATQTSTQETTRTALQIDPAHSFLEFSGRHMMVSTYKGRFTGVTGTIVLDQANPADSSVEAVVDATSVYTGSDQRDGHLKSPDFLDIANYPTLTFKSTRVEPTGTHSGRVTGDLTIRGTTRPITFEVEFFGIEKNPWGAQVAGFEAKSSFNRKDFGLAWNAPLESGGVLVADTVKVEIHVEGSAQS
ncbi:MAG TPA: YceI family protein [Chloroflexota bacterium]|nr:YceI family protein [Chloroflexota bacterium]